MRLDTSTPRLPAVTRAVSTYSSARRPRWTYRLVRSSREDRSSSRRTSPIVSRTSTRQTASSSAVQRIFSTLSMPQLAFIHPPTREAASPEATSSKIVPVSTALSMLHPPFPPLTASRSYHTTLFLP